VASISKPAGWEIGAGGQNSKNYRTPLLHGQSNAEALSGLFVGRLLDEFPMDQGWVLFKIMDASLREPSIFGGGDCELLENPKEIGFWIWQ
jgi:hypothetical protein